MFDALLLFGGILIAILTVAAASRPLPLTDPYYV